MANQLQYSNVYEDSNDQNYADASIPMGGLSQAEASPSILKTQPVGTLTQLSMPTPVTSLPSGTSEDAIGSAFSPYYATANTVDTTVTPAVNNYTDTQSVVKPNQIIGGLDQGLAQELDTQSVVGQPQVLSGLAQATPSNTNNILSGNIMAGASWHSLNPTLANELTQATGQQTLNTAIGGATTSDTLQQLNDFTSSGGSFAPGSNLILQQGGLDFVYGVDKEQTLNNLDQIISYMNQQGVNVILAGSPYASSFADVEANNFNPELDEIYNTLANKYSNVTLVDSMGGILQDKSLLADPIHPNAKGWEVYNRSIIEALNRKNNSAIDQG